jgi:hypothetical protein
MWAEYIGSGRFTTAFARKEDVYLYTFHGDLSKSILAHAHREHPNPHIPRVERLGISKFEGHIVNVYKAKFYRRVRRENMDAENKRIIHMLQEAHDEAKHEFPGDIVRTYRASEFNEIITRTKGLPDTLSEALKDLAHISLDWGDHYIFDNFHIRNLGLNGKGKLILLDPMFDMEKIQKDFEYRRRYGSN